MKLKKHGLKHQLAFKGGSYSLTITAIVLAILIVLNVFASALPSSLTQFDISASKLYSITSNTKVTVNNLKQDVTIYWIVQADEEDQVIENLLGKYESLSDHIKVVKKNPDVFPAFTEQYTSEDVPNNSLIVESKDRYRYISYNDIYLTESDMYSYTYSSSFDGEGAITSAIDYTVTEELPKLYVLEGHGEAELPSTFADSVEKENIETETLSLITASEIPEDADAILIYSPASDLSEKESQMLAYYVESGGKLLVMAGPVENGTLTNLNQILEAYHVTVSEGIAVESDREHYAFGYPYVLVPDMMDSEITESLISENYYPIFPLSQGLQTNSAAKAENLLVTSDSAFSKTAGFKLETYEKEDGDIDGPFALAVSIETDAAGKIIWFSSSEFLNDMYNSYSSGANINLAMNALSSLIGEREAIAIRSKSLNYNYLTITDSTASTLKLLMIGIFPLAYLGIGIYIIFRKRGRQNETN